jgi:hypothetical protein
VDDTAAEDSAFVAKLKGTAVLPGLVTGPAVPRPSAANSDKDKLRERLGAAPMSRDVLNRLPLCFGHALATLRADAFNDRGLVMVVQFESRA